MAQKAEKCHLFASLEHITNGERQFLLPVQKRMCADGYSRGSVNFYKVLFIVARDT